MKNQKGFGLAGGVIALLIICIVFGSGYYVLSKQNNEDRNSFENNEVTTEALINSSEPINEVQPQEIIEADNYYGQKNAVVTITEYSDFQCPACASFYPIVSQVKEKYANTIRFEFKHFPLERIHPNAKLAHQSAQAAAEQEKFWEMHDLLFERQQSWSNSDSPEIIFENYAKEIGLDVQKYKNDIVKVKNVVELDIENGKANNVKAVPAFFINGELVNDIGSLTSVESFSELIEKYID